jgi:hypothetical protein
LPVGRRVDADWLVARCGSKRFSLPANRQISTVVVRFSTQSGRRQSGEVSYGSWLWENARMLDGDRRSYSFNTVLAI